MARSEATSGRLFDRSGRSAAFASLQPWPVASFLPQPHLLNFTHSLVCNQILNNSIQYEAAPEEQILVSLLDSYRPITSPTEGVSIAVFQVNHIIVTKSWVHLAIRTCYPSGTVSSLQVTRGRTETSKSSVRAAFHKRSKR